MIELVNVTLLQPLRDTLPMQLRQLDFSALELALLRSALNQVDYGLVVVDVETGLVQFANALAQDALEDTSDNGNGAPGDTGLRLARGRVVARRPAHAAQLQRALERTRTGLRGLLALGLGGQGCAVAVMPLAVPPAPADDGTTAAAGAAMATSSHALLVFAKQQLCDNSTMALFARERGLTNAEGQVLAQVCRGLRPAEIASQHGVQISTVRTQLRSIRMKTSSETIRELVQKVSVLPPMARYLSAGSARPVWQ